MDQLTIAVAALALLIPLVLAERFLQSWGSRTSYHNIPSPGFSGRLTSYLTALRLLVGGPESLKQGYYQFPEALFKLPTVINWQILANGPELVNDIRRGRDEQLSFNDASVDILQLAHTIVPHIMEEVTHLNVIYKRFAGGFEQLCTGLLDEIQNAVGLLVPEGEHEWQSVPAYASILEVVARSSSRVFVGLPACRNPTYLSLAKNFSMSVFRSGLLINLLPKILRPIVGRFISPYNRRRKVAEKILAPVLEERLRLHAEHGGAANWEGKPNDLITWFIEEAKDNHLLAADLALRLFLVTFASVHSLSVITSQALFDLCAHPEYIEPLREEIASTIQVEGSKWTRNATAKLYKMDSFLRESLRYSGISGVTAIRKVMSQDGFTFSNGQTIPYGSFVGAPSYAIHHDPKVYPNPETFDAWRSYRLHSEATQNKGQDGLDGSPATSKYAATTPSLEYLPFGIGRQACPGRFFAIHQIKIILVHILMGYDFKLDSESLKPGERPDNLWIGYSSVPNTRLKVMLRRRSAGGEN